jgi:hypothetical protein
MFRGIAIFQDLRLTELVKLNITTTFCRPEVPNSNDVQREDQEESSILGKEA